MTPTYPLISNISSRTSSAAIALPFSSYALLFPLLSVLSPPPHLSPNRARGLESTCCSFYVQQLFEVCCPYPQQFLTFCDEPPVVIIDHRTALHFPSILSSIPCHLEYHLFATIFVKLSVQFFVRTPPCYVHRPPGCLLLLAIQVI